MPDNINTFTLISFVALKMMVESEECCDCEGGIVL